MIVLRRSQFKKLLSIFRNNGRMFSTEQNEDVFFETENKCGIIVLNKPKALNAINLGMVKPILEKLCSWENEMSMVIIRGVGKAFCAGGDIKGCTAGGPENTEAGKIFFKAEYSMNHKIGTYKLPYIALLDGITMGGGVGLSVHGTFRVATEKTVLSMPETAIGLFPDVGSSHFLSRIPGNLGVFLALTGHRLIGEECLKIGFATHYCNSADIPKIFANLKATNGDKQAIDKTLGTFSVNSNKPFSLEKHLPLINTIFGLKSIEGIFNALRNDGSPWALETLETLKKMSPTSLKITLQEILLAKSMNLGECLQMENRLAVAALEATISKDFYEGVRALLIDKDKNPKWNPTKIEDISEAMIQQCFAPISPEDELII